MRFAGAYPLKFDPDVSTGYKPTGVRCHGCGTVKLTFAVAKAQENRCRVCLRAFAISRSRIYGAGRGEYVQRVETGSSEQLGRDSGRAVERCADCRMPKGVCRCRK
jgi:hypothetical protein